MRDLPMGEVRRKESHMWEGAYIPQMQIHESSPPLEEEGLVIDEHCNGFQFG